MVEAPACESARPSLVPISCMQPPCHAACTRVFACRSRLGSTALPESPLPADPPGKRPAPSAPKTHPRAAPRPPVTAACSSAQSLSSVATTGAQRALHYRRMLPEEDNETVRAARRAACACARARLARIYRSAHPHACSTLPCKHPCKHAMHATIETMPAPPAGPHLLDHRDGVHGPRHAGRRRAQGATVSPGARVGIDRRRPRIRDRRERAACAPRCAAPRLLHRAFCTAPSCAALSAPCCAALPAPRLLRPAMCQAGCAQGARAPAVDALSLAACCAPSHSPLRARPAPPMNPTPYRCCLTWRTACSTCTPSACCTAT